MCLIEKGFDLLSPALSSRGEGECVESETVGSMNSQASQSSSSGCDGASLCMPKSSGVLTIPLPKYVCHNRLTSTRAVVGDFLSDNHRANANRPCVTSPATSSPLEFLF